LPCRSLYIRVFCFEHPFLFSEAGHPCWVVGEVVAGAGIEIVSRKFC